MYVRRASRSIQSLFLTPFRTPTFHPSNWSSLKFPRISSASSRVRSANTLSFMFVDANSRSRHIKTSESISHHRESSASAFSTQICQFLLCFILFILELSVVSCSSDKRILARLSTEEGVGGKHFELVEGGGVGSTSIWL